jgi:hypothetical protein
MTYQQEQRNKEIVQAIKNGSTLGQAGHLYGISSERVRQIALNAGVISNKGWSKPTLAQIEEAIALVQRGMPIQHAAEAIGTTWTTVRRHLMLRGLYTPTRPADRIRWGEKEDTILRKHYNSFAGAAHMIADMLGTTRNSVIGRANRLGLQRPK